MSFYTPLHVHSHYSLLDGLSKPKQITDRCLKIGAKSCALTDHGTISGAVQFHSSMRSAGIKPILGCEIYICEQDPSIKSKENSDLSHFLLLAKNYDGWKTLIKIISESNSPKYFYRKPRLNLDKLAKMLDGNIIGFCGHLGSSISDLIEENPNDYLNPCLSFISNMKEIFGNRIVLVNTHIGDKFILSDSNIKQYKASIHDIPYYHNMRFVHDPKNEKYIGRIIDVMVKQFRRLHGYELPIVEVDQSFIYIDPNHRWGRSPLHLTHETNDVVSLRILDELRKIK
jgi:DNA polymerase III alpha subunit